MTVFKTFLKILNKNKAIVIMYTCILLVFGVANMQTSDNSMNFSASKPDIMIVNNDEEKGITKYFIDYIKENANIIELKSDEDSINDGLFYRDVNYVIYIPENYRMDFLNNENPNIEIKSTGDYQASLAEMITGRYLKTASIYKDSIKNEEELIDKIDETLSKQAKVEITSKLDTNSLSKAAFYFNFESYSLLACLIYVICLILSTFNNEKIRKRIIISSTDYKKNNRILLLSNCLYSLVVWIFYLIISFIIIGNAMFSTHGLIYALNSLAFTMCATTIAFLISNLVQNKNAINGIVNVVALGSSFLCGAFVPLEFLPDSVLKISQFIPTYYYIKTNEYLTTLEIFNLNSLKPVLTNIAIILLFSIIFIILSNVVTRQKRKIG